MMACEINGLRGVGKHMDAMDGNRVERSADTMTERRVEIWQDGRRVGTIPQPPCRPRLVIQFIQDRKQRHGHPLAEIRTTDFTTARVVGDNGWTEQIVLIADPKLGLGDLEDICGFVGDGSEVLK